MMAAALSLALGLFSCKGEPKKKPTEKVVEEQEGITFQFTMPGGDPHLVDVRALHDNPEWAIDQLWMYVFDENGETIVDEPKNIRNDQEFKFTGTVARYTYKEDWDKTNKQRQFFFVANMNIGLHRGDTKATLMEKVHEKEMTASSSDILYASDPSLSAGGQTINVENDNGKRIPMTAYATQGTSRVIAITGNATVEVNLKRTVARIDIVNRIPGFVINKLELFNAFKKANVAEESTHELTDNRLTTAVTPFTALSEDNKVGKREGTAIKKAFYLYEGKNVGANDDQITYVKITADYGGYRNRVFIIPFKAKEPSTGLFSVPKDVKRNFLYTISLGTKIDQVVGAKVEFTITEEPWNADDFEEVVGPITVTKVHDSYSYSADITEYSSTGLTLNVGSKKGRQFTFKLKTDLTGHTAYETPTTDARRWIWDLTLTPNANNEAELKFRVGENETGKERVGHITLKSNACDEVFTITVKQQK